jgi:hypothetical protein
MFKKKHEIERNKAEVWRWVVDKDHRSVDQAFLVKEVWSKWQYYGLRRRERKVKLEKIEKKKAGKNKI